MVELLHIGRSKTKLALFSCQRVLGRQSHNDFFAVYGGQDRHTDIIFMPVYDLCNAPVLRFSFLGNVHAADNFDTRYHSGKQSDIIRSFLV